MKEEKIPPLPTREQELEYLDFLEKSIDTDPWITIHPKQYMAGPHRLRYKKRIEMRKEYYKTYAKNFLISVTLSWPLIILYYTIYLDLLIEGDTPAQGFLLIG